MSHRQTTLKRQAHIEAEMDFWHRRMVMRFAAELGPEGKPWHPTDDVVNRAMAMFDEGCTYEEFMAYLRASFKAEMAA